MLPAPKRSNSQCRAGIHRRLGLQACSAAGSAGRRPAEHYIPGGAAAGGHDASRSPAGRRIQTDRCGVQLQATRTSDARVLPCRSFALRRGRNTQPPRIRSGIFRERRRWTRRRETDSSPVQEPSLSIGRVPRCARLSHFSAAHYRYVFAATIAGRILLQHADADARHRSSCAQ